MGTSVSAQIHGAPSLSIMFVINGLGVGGAETQLITMMSELIARGHSIYLVTINSDMRLISRVPDGVRHFALGVSGLRNAGRAVLSFLRIVRKVRPDVVHAHLFQANILSRLTKIAGLKCLVVNTTHCNYDLANRRYNPYVVYRWTKRLVDVHTAVSVPALTALKKWRSVRTDRSTLLFNAIDIDRYSHACPGHAGGAESQRRPFKWIAIGRLDKVKNYDVLLDALEVLHRSGQEFFLDIAGEGPLQEELQQKVDRYGLADRVGFLGLVENLPSRIAEYDGYVISSDNEALPMALLEAMAAGLPVVATQVGEIPSILTSSRGGYSVPPGSTTELANAMATLMGLSIDELQKMGSNNREHVRDWFGVDRVVENWERIYFKTYVEHGVALV